MYADFFTKPLQGATLHKFWAVIQVILKTTPYLEMIFPRDMAKVTSQECEGNNYIQACITATAIADARRGTCTYYSGSPCMFVKSVCSARDSG